VAMGDSLFTAVQAETTEADRRELSAPAAEWPAPEPVAGLADEIEAWLTDQDPPPEEGAASSPPAPDDEGPAGATLAEPAKTTVRTEGQIDADQDSRRDQPEAGDGPDRVLPAIEARRAAGAITRQ